MEWYIKKIVNISTSRSKAVIVLEDIDQYLDDDSVITSLLLFMDTVSRSNKWASTQIFVIGTVRPTILLEVMSICQVSKALMFERL